jgi:hypothetical protein
MENKETLTAALEVAKKAAAKQEGNMRGMTLDTVSHLEFALGNLDAAVKAQEEAIKLVDGPQQPDMESFLEELKGLLKSKK